MQYKIALFKILEILLGKSKNKWAFKISYNSETWIQSISKYIEFKKDFPTYIINYQKVLNSVLG